MCDRDNCEIQAASVYTFAKHTITGTNKDGGGERLVATIAGHVCMKSAASSGRSGAYLRKPAAGIADDGSRRVAIT
jgi:hypothetical protein